MYGSSGSSGGHAFQSKIGYALVNAYKLLCIPYIKIIKDALKSIILVPVDFIVLKIWL